MLRVCIQFLRCTSHSADGFFLHFCCKQSRNGHQELLNHPKSNRESRTSRSEKTISAHHHGCKVSFIVSIKVDAHYRNDPKKYGLNLSLQNATSVCFRGTNHLWFLTAYEFFCLYVKHCKQNIITILLLLFSL